MNERTRRIELTTAERSVLTGLAHAAVSSDQRCFMLCRAEEIWFVPLEG
jgi:hypothetical protein